MLNGFKKWWKKQQEFSDRIGEKIENNKIVANLERKQQEAEAELMGITNGYLETYLNGATEKEKEDAKKALIYNPSGFPHYRIDYVGGHPKNIKGCGSVWLTLIPQGILSSINDDLIPYSEIKTIEFKTEEEVSRDVTLTRMIAFGVYALALKKEKRKVTDYLILGCEKNGIKYSIAFAGDNTTQLYTDLFERIAG